MSIEWSSIDVIDPVMDKEIIVKKDNGIVGIRILHSNQASIEWAKDWLLSHGYTKWSDTE